MRGDPNYIMGALLLYYYGSHTQWTFGSRARCLLRTTGFQQGKFVQMTIQSLAVQSVEEVRAAVLLIHTVQRKRLDS